MEYAITAAPLLKLSVLAASKLSKLLRAKHPLGKNCKNYVTGPRGSMSGHRDTTGGGTVLAIFEQGCYTKVEKTAPN